MVQFMHFSSSLLSLCDIHMVGAKEFWPLQLYMMALSIQVLFSGGRLSYRSLMVMEYPPNIVHFFKLKVYIYILYFYLFFPSPHKDTYMWVVYGLVCLAEWMQNRHVFEGDLIMCVTYDKFRRFSSQHKWCNFKNICQIYMCLIKGGLYAQNMITILGSIVNIIGEIF